MITIKKTVDTTPMILATMILTLIILVCNLRATQTGTLVMSHNTMHLFLGCVKYMQPEQQTLTLVTRKRKQKGRQSYPASNNYYMMPTVAKIKRISLMRDGNQYYGFAISPTMFY
jgi:hypothetical protein